MLLSCAFAQSIAARSEPLPLSAVVETLNVELGPQDVLKAAAAIAHPLNQLAYDTSSSHDSGFSVMHNPLEINEIYPIP